MQVHLVWTWSTSFKCPKPFPICMLFSRPNVDIISTLSLPFFNYYFMLTVVVCLDILIFIYCFLCMLYDICWQLSCSLYDNSRYCYYNSDLFDLHKYEYFQYKFYYEKIVSNVHQYKHIDPNVQRKYARTKTHVLV